MEDERIFIKCVKPTICKHQRSDITEYHDGNYDIDVWCGLSKERIKCKQSNCEKKEFNGISYDEAIEKMAIAILIADTPDNNENDELIKLKLNDTKMLKICKIYAKAALKALLEEDK